MEAWEQAATALQSAIAEEELEVSADDRMLAEVVTEMARGAAMADAVRKVLAAAVAKQGA